MNDMLSASRKLYSSLRVTVLIEVLNKSEGSPQHQAISLLDDWSVRPFFWVRESLWVMNMSSIAKFEHINLEKLEAKNITGQFCESHQRCWGNPASIAAVKINVVAQF